MALPLPHHPLPQQLKKLEWLGGTLPGILTKRVGSSHIRDAAFPLRLFTIQRSDLGRRQPRALRNHFNRYPSGL